MYYTKKIDTIDYLKKMAMYSDITHKHAAAVIYKNNIISTGVNLKNKQSCNAITIHAEINAIINIKNKNKKKSKNLDIIVIRSKNNILKNSRPCNNCIERLLKINIRKVYYSNEHGIIVHEFVKNMKKSHVSSGTKFLCG